MSATLRRALLLASALALPAAGCNFSDARDLAPRYDCVDSADCSAGVCTDGYCAQESLVPLSLVARVVPQPGPGFASYTFESVTTAVSARRDIALPPGAIAFGLVRFGGAVIPGQVSFRRSTFVAGVFADEQRALIPGAAWGEDGAPADYRILRPAVPSVAIFDPSDMDTPAWPGVPSRFVGRPVEEVFPPIVRLVDAPSPSVAYERHDLAYPTPLFTACAPGMTACTASGRVVSVDANGTSRPEEGVRVLLENVDSGAPCSTVAVTDSSGTFEIRVASLDLLYRLRLSGSPARPAFPNLELPTVSYDPLVGGDVRIPRFQSVRYVGRVEFERTPTPDAYVRAVSRRVLDDAGNAVFAATFQNSTRTTLADAAEGAGFFALALPEGDYDLVVSDDATPTTTTVSFAVVRRPFSGGDVLGETLSLSPSLHVAGRVLGPDGRLMPYATVDATPFVPFGLSASAVFYARSARAISDASGLFDLDADVGAYDLRVEAPALSGLAPAIGLDVLLGGAIGRTEVAVQLDYPLVLNGDVRGANGELLSGAKVEFYAFVPGDLSRIDRVVRLADVVTDDEGRYAVALPRSVGPLP